VPAFFVTAVEKLAVQIGFDYPTLSYTLALFLAYPLGLIISLIPGGQVKHFASFLAGAFLLQFTIGVQWIHILIATLVSWVCLQTLSPKLCKTVLPLLAVGYCVLGHLHRQFINYLGWDLDFTGPMMILTIKLYSISWNYYDGYLIKKGNGETTNRASMKCKEFSIAKPPNLIEFLGYCFCFSNVLAGPAYEYSIYNSVASGSMFIDPVTKKRRTNIPSRVMPVLKPLIVSIICMGLFVVGGGKVPMLDPVDPQHATPVFLTGVWAVDGGCPWWKRYLYQWVALFFIRNKYYFAWKNAEGANNTWFAGFDGFDKDNKPKGWTNANNMDIIDFELAPNVEMGSNAWNKKTSNWLTRYIYMRTGGSLVLTYSMSAFWHGFYPGYYMFFLTVPFYTICARLAEERVTPLLGEWGKNRWGLYGWLCIFTHSFLIEYFIQPFQLLAFSWAWAQWKSHMFIGHLLMVPFYIIVSTFFPKPNRKPRPNAVAAKPAEAKKAD